MTSVLVWLFLMTNLQGGEIGFMTSTRQDCIALREAVIADSNFEKRSVTQCTQMSLSRPERT